MSNTLLITRMTTENAGNEALSIALIRLVKAMSAGDQVRVLDRHPVYFNGFFMARFGRTEAEAVARFERLADAIVARFPADPAGPLAPMAEEGDVRLVEKSNLGRRRLTRLKMVIGLRGRLARLGLTARQPMQAAFNALAWADRVIWNPAGEFHPTGNVDEGVRLLLLMRVAQRLGARTAIVNHSLEATHPLLRAVIAHVYAGCDSIFVREDASRAEAIRLGVDPAVVREAPDLVFQLGGRSVATPSTSARPIVLSINGLEACKGVDEWDRLFEGLRAIGRALIFVTNSMNDDIAFVSRYAARYGIVFDRRQPGYERLQATFASADLVITSRLHSAILALAAGTPVVTLEPQMFKLTGIMDRLGYPFPTERIDRSGWSERLLASVETIMKDREPVSAFGLRAVADQALRIDEAYGSRLPGLGSRGCRSPADRG